jgi:hypothetical protein
VETSGAKSDANKNAENAMVTMKKLDSFSTDP